MRCSRHAQKPAEFHYEGNHQLFVLNSVATGIFALSCSLLCDVTILVQKQFKVAYRVSKLLIENFCEFGYSCPQAAI